MLVLTRKPEEQIRIGDDIVITIVRVKGNTVRIGVEAPKGVRVIRAELEEKPNESEAVSENLCTVERTVAPDHSRDRRFNTVGPRNGMDRSAQNSSPLGSYVLAARIPLPNPETSLNSRVG